jgi:outer membrane biosynthesis protein TonB
MTTHDVPLYDDATPSIPWDPAPGPAPSGSERATVGAPVLEVCQIWGTTLVDTRHYPPTAGREVSLGHELGWRWTVLGAEMGWVRGPVRHLLPLLAPGWSEVRPGWRSDFVAPTDDHRTTVFRSDGTGWMAELPASWEPTVDGEPVQGAQLRLEEGRRLGFEVAGQRFVARLVTPGARVTHRAMPVDGPFVAVGSMMGAAAALFSLVMWVSADAPRTEVMEVPDHFVELVLQAPVPEDEEEPTVASPEPEDEAGERAAGDEGTRGKADAVADKAKGSAREVARKELDRQVAESAGLLGALDELGATAGFGAATLDGLSAHVGNLRGPEGTAIGSYGLGDRDGGLGGGGQAEGLSGLGTHGVGGGRTGYGTDGGGGGAKERGGLTGVGDGTIVIGALERSVIDEVIKRHLAQIRYCYQRELQKQPSLAGKVVMHFTIARDGSVSAARTKSSSLGNEAVESCLVGRFLRMQFPQPEGNGIVVVSYPFLFSN